MKEVERVQEAYQKRVDRNLIDRYSLLRPGELYMQQRREREILRMLRAVGIESLKGARIFEIGCGRGQRLADFQRWGANPGLLHGVDIFPAFVEEARTKYPAFQVVRASAHQLPYSDGSFDIVAQFTVFTSILDENVRRQVAAEVLRVLKPGGIFLWYDFRYLNPRNPDVRPVGRAEIRQLFAGHEARLRTVTLLPPVARRLAEISTSLCRLLEFLPFFRSHILGVILTNRDPKQRAEP